jgi:MSHA pilin protein MshA
MEKQKGFTLVELIVVIVLLAILAAFAIPKYMSVSREARISVVKAMEGSVRAAADMVHGIAEAREITGPATVSNVSPGTDVDVGANLYPTATATGMATVIADLSNFTVTHAANVTTFKLNGAPDPDTCCVVYTNAGTAGTVPTVTIITGGA